MMVPTSYCGAKPAWTRAPTETDQPIEALRVALAELAANARSGQQRHDCDVHFGRAVGAILADAQRQIDARASTASVD